MYNLSVSCASYMKTGDIKAYYLDECNTDKVRYVSIPCRSLFTSHVFLEMVAKLSKRLMAWLKDKIIFLSQ